MSYEALFLTLKQRLSELSHLKSALAVLQWDQEVHMPPKAAQARAATVAELARLLHERFLLIDHDHTLTHLKKALNDHELADDASAIVREVWREYTREQKLTPEFVTELAFVTSEGQHIWAQARHHNDFAAFAPTLEKIVTLKQQEAKLVGFTDSPYDALLDTYEPGMTSHQLTAIFDEVKEILIPLLKQTQQTTDVEAPSLTGRFPLTKQIRFNAAVAKTLGFDFTAGRIDTSTHPFATSFHPHDVRITSRYSQTDLCYSLFSTLHEVGHALYEQGILAENFGTPLGESLSLAIHESQSRLWENQVGKGLPFWQYMYPKLQKTFPQPFRAMSLQDFYRAINVVRPSLIRTEADEITYNLHIILRFEIEKELIEGTLRVPDLPRIWNERMQTYLGVNVPDDTQGVLQDVHWSAGLLGYFPTYTLGNLYAAQFFATARQQIPNLDTLLANGSCRELREWLRTTIHLHGRRHTADDLVVHVTGQPLTSDSFRDYITTKFESLYRRAL